MLLIDPTSATPLVQQIVNAIRLAIEERRLRPGSKLPSIRKLSQTNQVSHFTVVEAYDRLVALGYLEAVRNAGFFVRGQHEEPTSLSKAEPQGDFDFDDHLLLRKVFHPLDVDIRPGVGTLPESVLVQQGLPRSLHALARENSHSLYSYGNAKGHAALRGKIADLLGDLQVSASTEQILLTGGASQALDLVSRYLVQRGDTVLVDEPGYHNLFLNLRVQGAKLVGVPRTPGGIDLFALEATLQLHRPKVYFINTRLQTPTGTSLEAAVCHRLLQLAEKYDFLIVEDDIYADMDPKAQVCLSSLDQLSRVIYIGSFSKVIAPSLRCGFIAARPELIDELESLKMACGLTSSELTEALAYDILLQGRQRKHVKQLREELMRAHEQVVPRLKEAGMELFFEPRAGLFLWARHREIEDATAMAIRARNARILLAPGQLFMPEARPVPWLRFNVLHSLDERLYRFLSALR
ncbi:PLP-dependent aminotransferase family protein [Pseudomonas sp. LRF_L74]|uniref:aminotransferase-like domain-containing protein n=1 Tax=Pseudomonas sp. LRF_L74 TaxID=3369422 RepID=UPI003F63FBDF